MAKLLTHEEFIEKLKIKNPTFFDNYEILDKYIDRFTSLHIKSKYGLHLCRIDSLYAKSNPGLTTCINKTEYVNNKFKDLQPELYKEISIINEFKNCDSLLVKNKYGVCRATSSDLFIGIAPHIRTALNKTEYWINMAREKYGDTFNYSLVNYKGCNNNIKIICKNNHTTEVTPTSHMKLGSCTLCQNNPKTKSIEDFIKLANITHNNFYSYEKVIYVNNGTIITVCCPDHGDFPATPYLHLNGVKCKYCAEQFNNFRYQDWVSKGLSSNKFQGFQFYIIECWNEHEQFYKLGKTFNNLAIRYATDRKMPYTWKLIHKIETSGTFICHLEHTTHTKFKNNHYEPLIKFGGHKTECFKFENIQPVIDFANNYKM